MLEASLNIPVPHQTEDLVFKMGLAMGPNSAEGSAQLKGWWHNPFGISDKISIGPVLAIAIEMQYGEPIPTSLGLQGGVMIGDTNIQAAFKIGDQPLIHAGTNKLVLADLVKFAGDLAGVSIPTIPNDALALHDVDFYLSSGVFFGDQFFPAGASFQGAVELFGKGASMKCQVGQDLDFEVMMDALRLGPLSVTGATTEKPQAAIKIGPSTQHILVNGFVNFLGLEKQKISIVADMLPTLKLQFSMVTSFTDLLVFDLEGKMLGVPSWSDISQIDFTLTASMQQEILDYITTQSNLQFAVIKQAIESGIDDAKIKMAAAAKTYNDALDAAQASFDGAKATWDTYDTSARAALTKAKADAAQQTAVLQANVAIAQQNLINIVTKASNDLASAKAEAASRIASEQRAVQSAKTWSDATVAGAQKAANDAVGRSCSFKHTEKMFLETDFCQNS